MSVFANNNIANNMKRPQKPAVRPQSIGLLAAVVMGLDRRLEVDESILLGNASISTNRNYSLQLEEIDALSDDYGCNVVVQ